MWRPVCVPIFTLMQSDAWPTYVEPGCQVVDKYVGNDFYKLFKCALGQVKADHHITYPPDIIPTKLTAEA